MKLLPLNRCRRLGGYVEDYAVHLRDFVADAAGYYVEEVVGEADPFGGHGVERGDGAEGDCFAVGAHVADYADAADGQQRAEGLPDVVVEASFADFFDEYRVGFAQDVEAFFFELSEAADGEARAGEGMALKEVRRDAEDFSDAAHFIFEKVAQRFEQPHLHVVGQAADVVVAFDYSAAAVSAFDYVGIYRSLEQPVGAAETARLFLEYTDEELAYYLALAFRLGHSR